MQRNINIAIGNDRSVRADEARFSCLFKGRFGGVGEYRCEARTLDEAIHECTGVAEMYPWTELGSGEEIAPLHISEMRESGNQTVAYRF